MLWSIEFGRVNGAEKLWKRSAYYDDVICERGEMGSGMSFV